MGGKGVTTDFLILSKSQVVLVSKAGVHNNTKQIVQEQSI